MVKQGRVQAYSRNSIVILLQKPFVTALVLFFVTFSLLLFCCCFSVGKRAGGFYSFSFAVCYIFLFTFFRNFLLYFVINNKSRGLIFYVGNFKFPFGYSGPLCTTDVDKRIISKYSGYNMLFVVVAVFIVLVTLK